MKQNGKGLEKNRQRSSQKQRQREIQMKRERRQNENLLGKVSKSNKSNIKVY